MDVFRYLFRDRGTKPTRGLGKLYKKVDFSEQFFSAEWDKVYDRLGDGCQVDFPIRMHSKLRWSPIVYTQGEDGMLVHKQQSFSEVVVLNVVKSISERCMLYDDAFRLRCTCIHHFILYAYEIMIYVY